MMEQLLLEQVMIMTSSLQQHVEDGDNLMQQMTMMEPSLVMMKEQSLG